MSENFKMIAKTFYGFEEILSEELLKLGAQKIIKGNRNVSFYGDKGFMYKSNISLRTALKIIKPIKEFKFKDIDEYYNCLLYTSPSPRDKRQSRMPSSA